MRKRRGVPVEKRAHSAEAHYYSLLHAMVFYSIATTAFRLLLGEFSHLREAVISEVPKL